MKGYVTAKDMAEKWGISLRRVQLLCSEGRIKGVSRLGNTWAIPADAKKPEDGRFTTGKYRNWRKKKNTEDEEMAIVKVIKYEGDNKTFVWRHPIKDFNTGSQLIVHEAQEAIFVVNGEVMDKFGPGSHTLETENLPFIRKLFQLATGGRNPFHAELYFVNKTEQMAIRWGTDSKIQYIEPEYKFPVEIGACGEMSLSVADSIKLLVKLVGTEKVFNQETLTAYFRAILMTRVKSILATTITDNHICIFEIDKHLSDLSSIVKEQINDDFYDYGVNLNIFLITRVNKPEDDRNYRKFVDLHYRRVTDVAEAELQQKLTLIEQETKAKAKVMDAEASAQKRAMEGYSYQQERGFDVAEEIARNDAVAQLGNIGIGMGMMTGVGSEMSQQVGAMARTAMQSTSAPIQESARFCSHCGKKISAGALFCEFCGTKLNVEEKCSKCGHIFTGEGNFCPICGNKRGE